jgi:ribosomal protein L37E
MALARRNEEMLGRARSIVDAPKRTRNLGGRKGLAPEHDCPRCGRRTTAADRGGMCAPCKQGRAAPLPRVETLPTDYLVLCVEELKRRRERISLALEVA